MTAVSAVSVLSSINQAGLATQIAAALVAGKQPLGGMIETREGCAITFVTYSNDPVAITATTGGGTTGTIAAGTRFCTVTSDSANKSIMLPAAAAVGDVIDILIGTTGCEMLAEAALDKVNEVVIGSTNELALTAEALYTCKKTATNKWIVTGETKLGARIAALVPDALA